MGAITKWLMLAVLGLASCQSAPKPETGEVEKAAAPEKAPDKAVEKVPEAPKVVETPLQRFEKAIGASRIRFDLVDMAHFADRSHEGHLAIDMGTVPARKYLNGGWRSGWSTVPRTSGKTQYFETDSRTARVFFKHTRGGFDRIVVRMKAPRKSNKVTVYVNDKAVSTISIGETLQDYIFPIPSEATREGENQLMMRFTAQAKLDGRNQTAHVERVDVLPKGAKLKARPRGERAQKVSFSGVAHPALVAATPQTYTYRLQLPAGASQLAFGRGAAQAGARFKVDVRSDLTANQTLLDATVKDDEAGAWRYEIVDMKAFEGQVVEIDLTLDGAFPSGQLAAWGWPLVMAPKPQDQAVPPKAPETAAKNVLIYLIDTMRYDKFDFYNPKTDCATPAISAFAADATIFDAAYDNENWTKPSCATILTGLYPDTHKTKEDTSRLPQSVTTISEHLQVKGFRTGSFIANGYVSDKFGFKQGWHYYTNYIREGKRTDADRLVDDTLSWIDKQGDKRFFAYVQTIDPHVPYAPPSEYRKRYWNRRYNGPIKSRSTGNQLADIKTGKMDLGAEDKKYLEALYNGEVTFNDFNFGRLVEGLKKRGIYDDTVVIIIADHGEEFWDHGSVGHGHSLYEEMIHSPMIVRYPNKVATGRRVPHVVGMVDLVPSLLDMVGVPHYPGIEGTSFVDAFDGVGEARPRIAVSDFLYRKKSVRAGRYKWISGGRDGQLFDVIADKREKKNMLRKHAIGRAFVRGQAGIFFGAPDKARWWAGSHSGAALPEIEADNIAELDPETAAQLEAMGYVEGARTGEKDEGEKDEEDEE